MQWLISPDFAARMQGAVAEGRAPTAAECATYVERERALDAAAALPRIMQITGNTAEISVVGALTQQPDLLAMLFGGGNTTYSQIQTSLAIAATDPSVRDVVLRVASPGGEIDGLFETLGVLETFPKPVTSVASRADSAAYAIAAVAGPIYAATLASEFGSIGVATTLRVRDDIVSLASREAPKKRPDVRTDDGRAVVQDELDAIHALFVDAIAAGRSRSVGSAVTSDKVNAEYGRGGVFFAAEAKRRGMIDKVPAQVRRSGPRAETASDDAIQETEYMDSKLLKTQHPDVYDAVLQEGIALERDRVMGHLEMGKGCGAYDIAYDAISSGAGMTHQFNARYLLAGRNAEETSKRGSELKEAHAVVNGAPAVDAPVVAADPAAELEDYVAKSLLQKWGKE